VPERKPSGAPVPDGLSVVVDGDAAETLFLSDADVRAALTWSEAIEAIRDAYGTPTDALALPPRTVARADGTWLRTLSAMPAHCAYMGVKLIAASPPARRASYLVALFDRRTTELVALLDGNHITGMRTAATSAVAIDALAPRRPLRAAVIGSGFEAANHVAAAASVREIADLAVFSPTEANRRRFADESAAKLGVHARAVASAEEAVRDADLVLAAARSRDESPTVRGAWLRSDATVVSIGSTLPEQRELDIDAIRRASMIVADAPDEVAAQTGDMIAATERGIEFAEKLVSLSDLVGDASTCRRAGDAIAIYKSVGSALQDVTVSELCVRRAREQGLGRALGQTITPVSK
jgi:ornithine cyclodeaminase/alanine dehydrogenase